MKCPRCNGTGWVEAADRGGGELDAARHTLFDE